MYDLFNDFVGVLPLRYQLIIPIIVMVFIIFMMILIFKLLGGKI